MSSKPSPAVTRRLKHRLRTGIDHAARWTGLLRWLESRAARGHTVLMYHRVLPETLCRDYPLPTLAMPAGAFRQQVEFLAARCDVLPVCEALVGEQPVSSRPRVSITFDDGYRDNYEIAAPILDSVGLRATFFVTTGFVESGEALWFDRAIELLSRASPDARARSARAHLPADAGPLCAREAPPHAWLAALKAQRPPSRAAFFDELATEVGPFDMRERYAAMTPAHVAELARRGHEIGSHTVTHALLPQLSAAALDSELQESLHTLADWTGNAPAGFCYPNGDHDAHVVDAVKRAGYRYACTVAAGINEPHGDPMRLRRLDITPENSGSTSDRCDLVAFRSELYRLHEAWRA